MTLCPCCSNKKYADCCGRFIDGSQYPATPEELMRSRYTAFTEANIDYIVATMKSKAAENFDALEAKQWAQKVKWTKLDVIKSNHHGTQGTVEFIAYFIDDNEEQIVHELSEFRFENGHWYYVDGIVPEEKSAPITATKIGRNDPCSCGSGKKYKKCCGI